MVVVIISIVVNLACPAPKVILCGSKRGTSGWKIWVHYHPVGCVDTVSWWSVLSLQQYKFYIPTSVHHPQCPAAGLIITMHSVMPCPHHHHHYYHHQHQLLYISPAHPDDQDWPPGWREVSRCPNDLQQRLVARQCAPSEDDYHDLLFLMTFFDLSLMFSLIVLIAGAVKETRNRWITEWRCTNSKIEERFNDDIKI